MLYGSFRNQSELKCSLKCFGFNLQTNLSHSRTLLRLYTNPGATLLRVRHVIIEMIKHGCIMHACLWWQAVYCACQDTDRKPPFTLACNVSLCIYSSLWRNWLHLWLRIRKYGLRSPHGSNQSEATFSVHLNRQDCSGGSELLGA
jgi:hypothetical protein